MAHYALVDGVDFNEAPKRDFDGAPLGPTLAEIARESAAFAPPKTGLDIALDARDYAVSDFIAASRPRDGSITDGRGASIYPRWRRYAERLEGYNAALFWASVRTGVLRRFIRSFGELGNYRSGRWRKTGDLQDRASTTAGMSNKFIEDHVAQVSYDARAVDGWMQPVRYSPYPRNLNQEIERFGDEKDGFYASGGEVHIHTGCPIPPRGHVIIRVEDARIHCRPEAIERYGGAGVVE